MAAKKPVPPAKKDPPRSTAVAPRPASALAKGLSNEDLLKDARSGMEGITSADMAIPRIGILQALNPQIDKRAKEYVEGAEIGMIFDNINEKLYDGAAGITLVLIQFQKSHIEWIPRSKGGGFVKNHGPDGQIMGQTTRTDTGENRLPNGNDVVPTIEYFCFILDEAESTFTPCVVSFSKSNMSEARRLTTVASTFQIELDGGKKISPALFYRSYLFKTVPAQNEKGKWFAWKFDPAENTVDIGADTGFGVEVYKAAAAFRESINSGRVKVADPQAAPAANSSNESAPM